MSRYKTIFRNTRIGGPFVRSMNVRQAMTFLRAVNTGAKSYRAIFKHGRLRDWGRPAREIEEYRKILEKL